MKILIVASTFGKFGGIEAFVLTLAGHVHGSKNFTARICWKLVKGTEISENLRLASDLCRVPWIEVKRGSQYLWKEIRDADVVHGQNAPPDVCIASMLCRKPLVLTIHNRWIRPIGLRNIIWWLASRRAERRWFNSYFVMNTWGSDQRKGIDQVVRTVSELRTDFAPLESRKGFVFLSRWIENKGADTLIHAYAKARLDPVEWPLCMIGDGPLRPVLEKEVSEKKIPGVEILGFVDESTKNNRISGAKWLVAPPNTQEDMGLTPIEGRARGIPCIISKDGGLPEVGGREALVCQPGDVESLCHALSCAAEMKEGEYKKRALATFENLKNLLVPLDFYLEQYFRVYGG